MRIYTWFGVFTIENGFVTEYSLFSKDAHRLAERIVDRRDRHNPLGLGWKIDLQSLAVDHGFVESREEYYGLLRAVMLEASREKIRRGWKKDVQVIHTASTIDELGESINLLQERLKNVFTTHFPEQNLHGRELAELIITYGRRSGIPDTHPLYGSARDSIGMQITDEEESLMRELAENIVSLYKLRHNYEEYLERTIAEFAPNLADLAGAKLTARLISLAGSLERLAQQPASRIQVIGAKKALFRHLEGRAPPPKHGIIYQHPAIKKTPPRLRGKIARRLAAKIAMASRIDLYSGTLNPDLKDGFEREMAKIKNPIPIDL
ncbi:rRNA biogenesis protein [Methanosarcinales archaeon]|nr:MAG: rRNA biogenesis protein [Methanosarcinales archaeon]